MGREVNARYSPEQVYGIKGGNHMYIGKGWNDKSIDLVKIDDKVYALYGWDGEEWADCWECVGSGYMLAEIKSL